MCKLFEPQAGLFPRKSRGVIGVSSLVRLDQARSSPASEWQLHSIQYGLHHIGKQFHFFMISVCVTSDTNFVLQICHNCGALVVKFR